MVRLQYNSSADHIVSAVETFGSHQPSGTYDLTANQVDLFKYQGDVNVRKLPYDPMNPYNATGSI